MVEKGKRLGKVVARNKNKNKDTALTFETPPPDQIPEERGKEEVGEFEHGSKAEAEDRGGESIVVVRVLICGGRHCCWLSLSEAEFGCRCRRRLRR